MSLTWPSAVVLVALVAVDGALVWRGILTPHTITGVSSAIVGFIVGRSIFLGNGRPSA